MSASGLLRGGVRLHPACKVEDLRTGQARSHRMPRSAALTSPTIDTKRTTSSSREYRHLHSLVSALPRGKRRPLTASTGRTRLRLRAEAGQGDAVDAAPQEEGLVLSESEPMTFGISLAVGYVYVCCPHLYARSRCSRARWGANPIDHSDRAAGG
eukprot:scaffold7446_cov403-Prasinococcus_capsulatus_cf.AAC.10